MGRSMDPPMASQRFVAPGIFRRTKAAGPGQRLPWEPSRLLTLLPYPLGPSLSPCRLPLAPCSLPAMGRGDGPWHGRVAAAGRCFCIRGGEL